MPGVVVPRMGSSIARKKVSRGGTRGPGVAGRGCNLGWDSGSPQLESLVIKLLGFGRTVGEGYKSGAGEGGGNRIKGGWPGG